MKVVFKNKKKMKTKTIEVKFPTIEGMKVENASVDLKNGVSVVEYVEDVKFKKGDVLSLSTYRLTFIGIYSHTENNQTYCFVDCLNGLLEYDDWGIYSEIRLATDSEKQLLFDALEKEGKYWDAESLEVKDIPKEEIIKNIFRELRGHNISVNEAYRRMHKIIPING